MLLLIVTGLSDDGFSEIIARCCLGSIFVVVVPSVMSYSPYSASGARNVRRVLEGARCSTRWIVALATRVPQRIVCSWPTYETWRGASSACRTSAFESAGAGFGAAVAMAGQEHAAVIASVAA